MAPTMRVLINQFDVRDYYGRLKTFMGGFKSKCMATTSLAYAGFVYVGIGPDSVACPWCRKLLCNFRDAINPLALHMATSSESCKFIQDFCSQTIQGGYQNLKDSSTGTMSLITIIRSSHQCKKQHVEKSVA